MIYALIAFIAGILFGFGLFYSGMANPAVVQGFLDLFGDWNPALIWVMIGAIPIAMVAMIILNLRNGKTLLNRNNHLPQKSVINIRLVIGGLTFGVGWGLVGICPAPALLLVGAGIGEGLIFVASMLVGMQLFKWINQRANRRR